MQDKKEFNVNEVITLKGIEQAIESLNYRNKNALKYRLAYTIREYYHDDSSVETLKEIDSDELIRLLWNEESNPAAINNKRKNFNSLKSSINTDLKKQYAQNNNPEGIIIGPNNTFCMSDEAKDNTLKAFINTVRHEGTVNLDEVSKALNAIDKILSDSGKISNENAADNLKKLEELKNTIRLMSEKYGGFNHAGSSDSVQNDFNSISATAKDSKQEIASGAASGDGFTETETANNTDAGNNPELPEAIIDETTDEQIVELEEGYEIIDEDIEEVEIETKEDDNKENTDEHIETATQDSSGRLPGKSGSETEYGGKESPAGESGLKGDSDKDGAGGDAFGSTSSDMAEAVDVVDDDELEIIEEIDTEDLEENDGTVDNDGNNTGNNFYETLQEEEYDISDGKPGSKKNDKLLAEEFNHSLAAMDKYFNQYILIPGGNYIIGSRQPKRNECLERNINLPAFYMGKYPVTNALFEVFAEKTGYKTTAEKRGYGKVYFGRYEKTLDGQTGMGKLIFNATTTYKTIEGACWYQPCGPKSTIHRKRNHPVVQVSFEDAMAFAAWTGKRLPTENEWEAASRTDKGYSFPWGESFRKEACNVEESSICGTSPVDLYREFENGFGIADTLGNVFEWTTSRLEKFMVVKGGCWISGNDIKLFTRFQIEPDNHSNILGFRCIAY